MIISFELRPLALDLMATDVFMLTTKLLVCLRPAVAVVNGIILSMYIVILLAERDFLTFLCTITLFYDVGVVSWVFGRV